MRNVVTVSVEVLAHDEDVWCPDCLTSGGVRLTVASTSGPTTSLQTATDCYVCRANSPEVT